MTRHTPEETELWKRDPGIRALMDEMQDAVEECALANIVGTGMKIACVIVTYQEQMDRFYARMNERPLEERLQHFAWVTGEDWDEVGEALLERVSNIEFSAEVSLSADDVTKFDLTIKPQVMFVRPVERIEFTVLVKEDGDGER